MILHTLYAVRVKRDTWEGDYSAVFYDKELTRLKAILPTPLPRDRKRLTLNCWKFALEHMGYISHDYAESKRKQAYSLPF